MNLPNTLTLFRIGLIPVFVIAFYIPFTWHHWLCAVVFALAAITDWFDGYLARRLNQVSPLGAFLDPVADKLVIAVALVFLVAEHGTALLAVPASVIVSREIVISALREWMAEYGKRAKVAVTMLGKVKTALQMIAITILLSQPAEPQNDIVILGFITLYAAAILTLWSMYEYLKIAWEDLTISNRAA